jgi:hypothetical protein
MAERSARDAIGSFWAQTVETRMTAGLNRKTAAATTPARRPWGAARAHQDRGDAEVREDEQQLQHEA